MKHKIEQSNEREAPVEYQKLYYTLMAAISEAGLKNGAVLWPLRIAISGQASTPGGAIEIAWLLGKDETLRRIDEGIKKLG